MPNSNPESTKRSFYVRTEYGGVVVPGPGHRGQGLAGLVRGPVGGRESTPVQERALLLEGEPACQAVLVEAVSTQVGRRLLTLPRPITALPLERLVRRRCWKGFTRLNTRLHCSKWTLMKTFKKNYGNRFGNKICLHKI